MYDDVAVIDQDPLLLAGSLRAKRAFANCFAHIVEHGVSENKAEYILSAPAVISSDRDIECLTFDEYFEKYKNIFYISLRRVWRGQDSNSEHRRAVGLCSKAGNSPWCFKSISGEPRSGWMSSYPSSNRMTAYILFITLKP